jgi:hydrogenase/urease accessory protein HupE
MTEILNKLPVRKVVTLFFVLIYGILCVLSFIQGKPIPTDMTAAFTMVVGYYFGKSTALDIPTKAGE